MQVDTSITFWLIDYLMDGPQFVRLRRCGEQHRSTAGDCALTFPLHALYLRLLVQLRVLSSEKILR